MGSSGPIRRERGVEQAGRGPAGASGRLAGETDDALAGLPLDPGADKAIVNDSLCARLFAESASVRAGTSTWRRPRRSGARAPVQLADGQAVPVGRGEREPVAVDLQPDAGQHRQRVVAPGGDGDLGDGGGEFSLSTVPAVVGMLGSVG